VPEPWPKGTDAARVMREMVGKSNVLFSFRTLRRIETFEPDTRATLETDIKYRILRIEIRGLECDSVTLH
jgi:hypothetical protein